MQTNTLLTLIVAGLVLALIGFAIYSRRTAGTAHANGYDQGYEAALLEQSQRITALNQDIARLQELAAAARMEHGHQLEAIMQDCDERIAIYARRASPFGVADRLVLADVNTMLKQAGAIFSVLQANNSAVRARDLMGLVQDMDRRLVATLPASETAEQGKAA